MNTPLQNALLPEAYVVRLAGTCCDCARSDATDPCGACEERSEDDDQNGKCNFGACGKLNGDFLVRRRSSDACVYEHVFTDAEFGAGGKPCQVEKLCLTLKKHDDDRVSCGVALLFEPSENIKPVAWWKDRVNDCGNIGTLRRNVTNTKCCFPRTIEVSGVPVPDFVAPQPEWYAGDPEDLNDAPFWPSLDVDPMEDSPEVPVRYFNGELQLRVKDVASNGFEVPWGHTRIYSNRLSNSYDFGNGSNWLIHEWPRLVATKTDPNQLVPPDGEAGKPTGCTLVAIRGTRNSLWFDEYLLDKGVKKWRSRFGAKHVLKHDQGKQVVRIFAPNGHLWEFHDFSRDRNLNVAPPGAFARHEDAAENEIRTCYQRCQLTEVWRSGDSGDGTIVTESFVYDYYKCGPNNGRLHTVLLKRTAGERATKDDGQQLTHCQPKQAVAEQQAKAQSNACANGIRRAEYLYYEKGEQYGNIGDLKMAATQSCQDGRWKNLAVHYYRYRKQPLDTYCQGLLEFAVGPEAFRRIVATDLGATADKAPTLGKLDKELEAIANAASLKQLSRRFVDYLSSEMLTSYADMRVCYDNERRVSTIALKGGSRQHGFVYKQNPAADQQYGNTQYNDVHTLTRESRVDGTHRLVLCNISGQVVLSMIKTTIDLNFKLRAGSHEIPTGKGATVEHRVYGRCGNLVQLRTPSSIDHSLPIDLGRDAVPRAFETKGLVRVFGHKIVDGRSSYLLSEWARQGTSPSLIQWMKKYVEVDFKSGSWIGDLFSDVYALVDIPTLIPNSQLLKSFAYLPKRGENIFLLSYYRQLGVGNHEKHHDEETFFAYDLTSRGHIQRRATMQPKVRASQSGDGPDQFVTTARQALIDELQDTGKLAVQVENKGLDIVHERFDVLGNLVEHKDVRGASRVYKYFADRGAVRQLTVHADGIARTTDFETDALGRTTRSLGPPHSAITQSAPSSLTSGLLGLPVTLTKWLAAATVRKVRTATWTSYKDMEGEVWTAQGFTDETGNNAKTMGAVAINKFDRAGRTVHSIDARPANVSLTSAFSPTPLQRTWERWQYDAYDNRGVHTTQRIYHLIPELDGQVGTKNLNYDETRFSIDFKTRTSQTTGPGGTVTKTAMDTHGMLLTTEVGTTKENMTVVEQRDYDEFDPSLNPDRRPNQGGNGLLSRVVRHDGKQVRVTLFGYDWRDRTSKIMDPGGSISAFQHTTSGNVTSADQAQDLKSSGVVHRRESYIDNRGRTYKVVEHGVFPSTAGADKAGRLSGHRLSEAFFHNGAGDVVRHVPAIGEANPGTGSTGVVTATPVIEFSYDQIGQRIRAGTYYLKHNRIGGYSKEREIESLSTKYDPVGNVIFMTMREYFDTIKRDRTSHVAMWHDALGRERYTADYGAVGHSAIMKDRPVAVPLWQRDVQVGLSEPDIVMVDHRGPSFSVADPAGRTTRLLYDHAGRLVQRIENYLGTGRLKDLPSPRYPDRNRITKFSYTPDGEIQESQTLNPGAFDQVTRFIFDNTQEAKSPHAAAMGASGVFNSQLLHAVEFPDKTRVEYRYNQQGEVKAMCDQNGTIHNYEHDKYGRLIEDRVARFGPHVEIDKTIDTITYRYNNRGLISDVVSHSSKKTQGILSPAANTAPAQPPWNIVQAFGRRLNWLQFLAASENSVYRAYDEFDQLLIQSQSHTAHESPTDRFQTKTTNEYATADERFNRLAAMQNPSPGRQGGVALGHISRIVYQFNEATVDDALDRPSGLTADAWAHLRETHPIPVLKSQRLADLQYWGLDNSYGVNYPQAGIQSNLGDPSHIFGLDRFDRNARTLWETDNDFLVHHQYGYDAADNLRWQADYIAPDPVGQDDYDYDSLDRITGMRRVPGQTGVAFSQSWTRDAVGNVEVFAQDDDGDGKPELRQLLVHDPASNLRGLQPSSDPADLIQQLLWKGHALLAGVAPKGPGWRQPEIDAAGNLTRMPQPDNPSQAYQCVYDAWNRLAEVREPQANGKARKVAAFRYDGLGRLAAKLSFNEQDKVSEERHFAYSTAGQLVQEHVRRKTLNNKTFFRADRQYVWGPRSPNDLILRQRDKNGTGNLDERLYAMQDALGNVVALADESGKVQERFRYRPTGEVEFYDANYTKQDESASDWDFLLGAGRRDSTTGLIIGNDGAYHPTLGRPLQREILLQSDEATFEADYQHLLSTADPESFNTLQMYVPPQPERSLWDRIKSLAVTAGVVALNVLAWANPIGYITGPLVTGATLGYGIATSYETRQAQSIAMRGRGLDTGEAIWNVFRDVTGISAAHSIIHGEDIFTGQKLSAADRIETLAHFAVGIAVGRAMPPVVRAVGRRVGTRAMTRGSSTSRRTTYAGGEGFPLYSPLRFLLLLFRSRASRDLMTLIEGSLQRHGLGHIRIARVSFFRRSRYDWEHGVLYYRRGARRWEIWEEFFHALQHAKVLPKKRMRVFRKKYERYSREPDPVKHKEWLFEMQVKRWLLDNADMLPLTWADRFYLNLQFGRLRRKGTTRGGY